MRPRGVASLALPLVVLAAGFALGAVVLRERVVAVTFQEGGRAFRADDGPWRPTPATLTLQGASWVRLRVVNRDVHYHALGILSVEPGDSVEVRPDVCATAWRGPDLVVLVR